MNESNIQIHSHGEDKVRSNPVFKIPIFSLIMSSATALLAPPVAKAATSVQLRGWLADKLVKYCVPIKSEDCGDFQARYDRTRGTCDCGDAAYTRYNSTARKCEIICPAGQIPETAELTGCPAGYGGLEIKNF
jgi:hypothetical protein